MSSLSKDYKVEKSYELIHMIKKYTLMSEFRLLEIYLSRINARESDTRTVRFSLHEFKEIMNIEQSNANIPYYKKITKRLLQKVIEVPTATGGYRQFVLFSSCIIDKDEETGEYYFELKASEEATPLFFNLSRYTSYQLRYILSLSSINQYCFYAIFKEREKTKQLHIPIEELRLLLDIGEEKYKKYNDFKRDLLDVCIQEINKKTDITVEYEPIRRADRGRKVIGIKFMITSKPSTLQEQQQQKQLPTNINQKQTPNIKNKTTSNNKKININKVNLKIQKKSTSDKKKTPLTPDEIKEYSNHPFFKAAKAKAKEKYTENQYEAISEKKILVKTSINRIACGYVRNWIAYGCNNKKDLLNAGFVSSDFLDNWRFWD